MASAEFDEKSAEKRPAVQVGDPFMEKLLMEACLEVMRTGAVVGIQDMGAAGLTCATSEMSSRGGTGMDIDVTLVPQRETGHGALRDHALRIAGAHAARRREGPRAARSSDVFEKWDLHAVHVGTVTDTGRVRLFERGIARRRCADAGADRRGAALSASDAEPAWQRGVQQLDLDDAGRAGRSRGGVRTR